MKPVKKQMQDVTSGSKQHCYCFVYWSGFHSPSPWWWYLYFSIDSSHFSSDGFSPAWSIFNVLQPFRLIAVFAATCVVVMQLVIVTLMCVLLWKQIGELCLTQKISLFLFKSLMSILGGSNVTPKLWILSLMQLGESRHQCTSVEMLHDLLKKPEILITHKCHNVKASLCQLQNVHSNSSGHTGHKKVTAGYR